MITLPQLVFDMWCMVYQEIPWLTYLQGLNSGVITAGVDELGHSIIEKGTLSLLSLRASKINRYLEGY